MSISREVLQAEIDAGQSFNSQIKGAFERAKDLLGKNATKAIIIGSSVLALTGCTTPEAESTTPEPVEAAEASCEVVAFEEPFTPAAGQGYESVVLAAADQLDDELTGIEYFIARGGGLQESVARTEAENGILREDRTLEDVILCFNWGEVVHSVIE